MKQITISKSITNRESKSLEKYFQEINKIALIPPAHEVSLFQFIKQGDKKALNKIIEANLRFVVSVAKQYQGQGLDLADLINIGNLGLIEAAKRFDETKGFKFISYAVWWIRQSIMQELAENSRLVRLPLHKVTLYSRIQKGYSVLEQEYARDPSVEELSELLEVRPEEISNALLIFTKHLSIDKAVFSNGEEIDLVDAMQNPNAEKTDKKIEKESLRKEIYDMLGTFKPMHQDIIKIYFGFDEDFTSNRTSLKKLAKKYNCTEEWIRQIKDRILKKLKDNKERLRKYLG